MTAWRKTGGQRPIPLAPQALDHTESMRSQELLQGFVVGQRLSGTPSRRVRRSRPKRPLQPDERPAEPTGTS